MAPVLQKALPIVGSALGRRMGVRVEVSGHKACTDGECIWLPAFELENQHQEEFCWGYLAHEAAHVRFTDFSLDYDGSPLRQRLTNLFEDIRIEKAMTKVYPGAGLTLNKLIGHLVQEGRLTAPKADDLSMTLLHNALLVILRFDVLEQSALEPLAREAREVLEARLSNNLLMSLNSILNQVPELSSTLDARNLADEVIALFQNHRNEDSENRESDESSGDSTDKSENLPEEQNTDAENGENHQSQNDKSESEPEDDLESDSEEGSQDNPENVSDNVEASEKAEDDSFDKTLGELLNSTKADWPEDLFQVIGQELENWSQHKGAGLSAITTTPQVDEVIVDDQDRDYAKTLLWNAQSESSRLAAQLSGLVQAKTLTRCRIGKRGMKLDGRRLHRTALNDGRLFKKRSESIAIDACVHISLDISSSMASRMPLAREAVLSLLMALKTIKGVTASASAYPGISEERVYSVAAGQDKPTMIAERLAALYSHDTTPMATGLWNGIHQVLQEKAQRRLILMITDGEPDSDHHGAVVDLVERCQHSGLDVIGLGICTPLIKELFPYSLTIEQLSDLKSALFAMASDWLLC